MPLTILATNPSADLYGASRMALESVRGFRERGWDVAFTVPELGPLVDAAVAAGAVHHPCPTPILRKGDLSPLGLLRLTARTLAAVPPGIRLLRAVRPDVLYVSTITEPLWLVLGRLLRVPVVCHVHEGEAGAARWLRRLLALPLLLATRLIANSQFSASVAIDAFPRLARRTTVIYNGVAGPAAPVAPRPEPGPPIRLLYLGRLSERKGVADAVEAVAELDRRGVPAQLRVVGGVFPGYEEVAHALQVRADELDGLVELHGFDADVWPHLAWSDLLVVPSRVEEPFGNTAVEGALAARPVIATATGGLPEAIEGMAAARLVPPGDPSAIADAVEAAAAHWPATRAAATDDRARAVARFSPAAYREAVAQAVGSTARS